MKSSLEVNSVPSVLLWRGMVQLVWQRTHRWVARSDKGILSKTEVSFSCPWKKIHTENPSEVGTGFKTVLMQNKSIPFQMFGLSTFKATSTFQPFHWKHKTSGSNPAVIYICTNPEWFHQSWRSWSGLIVARLESRAFQMIHPLHA